MPQENNRQPINHNIKFIFILGILISFILIATIGIITWFALKNVNLQVESLVNETSVKANLIYEMRVAARERNLRLAMSLLASDSFVIDQEWMRFKEQGSLFLIAREKFKSLNLSDTELSLLKKQRELSKHAVKLQYEINEHRIAGEYDEAIHTLHQEISLQVKIFTTLDDLLEINRNNNQLIIENIFLSQKNTQKTISILIIFIFSIIYLTSAYLTKRLSRQEQEILNEEIKYKALIEGSMDSILVLDNKHVCNCNTKALEQLSIDSLDQLNQIGLDYFSTFSETQYDTINEGIFNAINHALASNQIRYAWTFIKSDGQSFPADVELQSIKINDRNYVQMIIRDTSEREKAQKELHDANENLEKKIRERTEQLNQTNTKMIDLARSAGMSEVASGVLHNVGNVLNSVNVSASVLKTNAIKSRINNVEKISNILIEHSDDLNNYLKHDEAGKLVIPYIEQLSKKLSNDQHEELVELDNLIHNIDHIKNIISLQQTYAGNVGVVEKISSSEVVNDAININISSINNYNINLSKYYDTDIELSVDKHKLIQILVNLISNAKHAVVNGGKADKDIIIGTRINDNDIVFCIEDNGIGINKVDLSRVFEFGFKKRIGGHGYGLHHSAIVAKELGGKLIAESDGLNSGAKFTLTIPIIQS